MFCRSSDLADFKRPRDYVFLDEIPKSPVGKVLRRLLVSGDYRMDERVSVGAENGKATSA